MKLLPEKVGGENISIFSYSTFAPFLTLRHLADVKRDLDVQHQVIGRDGVGDGLGIATKSRRIVRETKPELLRQELLEAL